MLKRESPACLYRGSRNGCGARRDPHQAPRVLKRGFSACLYQGPRNWVVTGLLQGACQKCEVVPKKLFKKRKAPEYGALAFSAFNIFLARHVFQGVNKCAMPVRGALKRCTVLKPCGDPNVGAGLLAKAARQSIRMLTEPSSSRASPLPHWIFGVLEGSISLHRPHHHPHRRPSSPAP